MIANRWLGRAGLALFVAPFVAVGAWLAVVRADEHAALSGSIGAAERATMRGASGRVRLSGVLVAGAPAHASDGAPVALALIAVKRLERGGGARVCLRRSEAPTLRLDSGEQVSLTPLWDAQLDLAGWRRASDERAPLVRVIGTADGRSLDDSRACPPPPATPGRVSITEHALPLGERVTVVACAREGALEPCGADSTAIVVGRGLSALGRAYDWNGERALFVAVVHLVLALVLGALARAWLRPGSVRPGRVEVVQP